MPRYDTPEAEGASRPIFYVCLALLFMGFLFGVSMILAGDDESEAPGKTTDGRRGSGPLPIFPHSPVYTNSPVPDGPSVTIVQDIRETMRRLPDRNLPKGWPDPTVKKPK